MARLLLFLIILCGLPGRAFAQEPADSLPPWRYRGKPPQLQPLVMPSLLQEPWLSVLNRRPLTSITARPDLAGTSFGFRSDATSTSFTLAVNDSIRRARLLRRLGYEDGTHGMDTEVRGVLGLSPRTAELKLEGELQVNVSTSRQRALHCTPVMLASLYSGCQGKFSAPKVDNTLIMQSHGLFGQRLHVDIDLNTSLSYDGNNVIRAYFQGLEDEVVQRVEAGTVQFRAPSSRYLGASIPINNKGLSAEFQLGPVTAQVISAHQEGSSTEERIITIGDQTTQAQDRHVPDLDFETGRFFWIVNPTTLPGYPAVDILSLDNVNVPDDQRPSEVQVYRYVAANQPGTAGATYDGILATGLNLTEKAGPLRWRVLQQNIDYWVDPSGLWMVLAGSIDPNDFLAVSYRTRGGTLVGTLPVTDNPGRADTVRLIAMPNRGPTSPVFAHAMRQVYRVGGDLVTTSLKVGIEVARSESPASGTGTYLSELGMAVPTDPASFDLENRLFPRSRDPGASQVIHDHLIVFPNAQPFADPAVLTAAERNDSLYRTPEYLLSSQGPPARFQIRLRYDALSSGDKSGFFLGEIRAGSERITAGGRILERGVDYRVEYETGQIIFLKPKDLFPASGGLTISASYERQSLFAIAPTSIQGLTATWAVGRAGTISLVSLYQREQSAYRRPPVGSEPKAGFLGGVTSAFNFSLPAVTKMLSRLSRFSTGAPTTLAFTAEMALSRPDPNRYGEAFLEEFEDDGGTSVLMAENAWIPGSSPERPDGVENLGFANGFQLKDAVQLTFQNLVQYGSGFYEVYPEDIDSTIKVTDTRSRVLEQVLWTTVHADTAGGMVDSLRHSHWTLPHEPGKPRWRSMTTSLSNVGIDVSRNEYLEFWLYQAGDNLIQSTGTRMVFDIGKVSEDAVSLAPTNFTVSGKDTTWTGRQVVGLGRLDTERSTLGTWNALTDDKGILADRPDSVIGPDGVAIPNPSLCLSKQTDAVVAYPLGDLSGRCTRGNGLLDTEDLDSDGVLDALGSSEDVQRYIVDLRDPKYFVRDRSVLINAAGSKATWTLYRVPLRNPDAIIGQPDLRLTKQLRVTFVSPPGAGGIDPTLRMGFARMRLTGAPWIRRADRPIVGLSGTSAEAHGSVVVGSVSTQNIELGYTPPPGLGNTANQIGGGIGEESMQVNEKALRIIANDLRGGERAEAYHRLTSGGQNLLAYRELRVWMRGYGPGWASHDLEAYLKIGSDINNYYFYHVPVSTTTWEPDVVIELERWRALRADIEARFQRGEAPSGADACGGDPTAWIACDGPYFVQMRDPQINPPNLASVQELAAGIWRPQAGTMINETELWVDDIRLKEPIAETGVASAFGGRFIASDVGTFDLDWSRRDGRFQPLGESPSYNTVTTGRIGGTLRLDRLVPTLGFEIPVSFSKNFTGYDPQLISGTDIRGSALEGLRQTHSDGTSWSISMRRRAGYSTSNLARLIIDPMQFSASGSDFLSVADLSKSQSSTYNVNLGYLRSVSRRGYYLGLRPLVGALPSWLRGSDAGRGLAGASFALLPTTLRFSSTLSRSVGDYLSYKTPIERLSDTILRPVTSVQQLWSNGAGVTWQPLGMLNLVGDWHSTRDLRHYPDSTSLGRVVGASRRAFLGQDVGVERDRNVTSTASLTPRINSWLRPQLTSTSNFFLSRSLTSRNPVRLVGDTAGGYVLPQTLNNSRSTRFSLDVDPLMIVRRAWGDSSHLAQLFSQLRPVNYSRTYTTLSTYDLVAFNPALSYQLGMGGLGGALRHQGQSAISAGEMWTDEFTANFDLPASISLTTRYISAQSDRYQGITTGGFLKTSTQQKTWPSGDFRWNSSLTLGPLVGLATGAHLERQSSLSQSPTPDGGLANATSVTRTFRPNAALTFRNGMTLDVSTTTDQSVTQASGNTTRRDTDVLEMALSASIRMPRAISRLRRSMTTRFSMSSRSDLTCLERNADSGCVTFSDQTLLELQGNFFAVLGGQNQRVGADVGWSLENNRSLRRQVSRINLRVYFIIPLTFIGS